MLNDADIWHLVAHCRWYDLALRRHGFTAERQWNAISQALAPRRCLWAVSRAAMRDPNTQPPTPTAIPTAFPA